MREIKFRGKSGGGKWVYGDLASSRYGNPCIGGITKIWSEVKKDTVGQYTGMKDSNEKEVYEGDIVVTCLGIRYVVMWIDEYARFAFYKPGVEFAPGLASQGQFEIIGSIWDNPELLGGDTK